MPEIDLTELRKALHGGAHIGPGEGLALLDLVEQIGTALEGWYMWQKVTRCDPAIATACSSCTALAAYQRARGEA